MFYENYIALSNCIKLLMQLTSQVANKINKFNCIRDSIRKIDKLSYFQSITYTEGPFSKAMWVHVAT